MKRRVDDIVPVKQENNSYRGTPPLSPRVPDSHPGGNQYPVQSVYSSSMPGATTPSSGPPKMPSGGLQGGAPTVNSVHALHQAQTPLQGIRQKIHGNGGSGQVPLPPPSPVAVSAGVTVTASAGQQQFQRLKVEDALSYLDQVKYKFGNQPQVYNDFLDIMKEFKSQSIDTPGVIQRVSNLFKGHPELIVGFNTFLPPGYKIEVQSNEQGYAFQVSVSVPSPTSTTTMVHAPTGITHHPLSSINVTTSSTGQQTAVVQPPALTPSAIKSPNMQSIHGSVGSHHSLPPANPPNHHGTSYHHPTTGTTPNSTPHIPNNTVHHNNSHHHHGMHQAVSQALGHVESPGLHAAPQNQPVEFNHAINYVNKIKNRFQGQPDKYKRFLEILHTYQKEQRNPKDSSKHLTEAEVYSQVAKLFENQEDLLAEFGQFLPDATSHQAVLSGKINSSEHSGMLKKPMGIKPSYNNSCNRDSNLSSVERGLNSGTKFGHTSGQVKRSPSYSPATPSHGPPAKKHKSATLKDVTLAEASKFASLGDYHFFDKARKAIRNQEAYEDFLRLLIIFNREIISKSELVLLATPFLAKFPDLLRWFKEFVGHNDTPSALPAGQQMSHSNPNTDCLSNLSRDRPVGDLAMEIDYTTCKRLGASYCALPKSYIYPKCSGRTQLCREVLNDTWVSFPTWSEDSTFVTSRKTQYEEYIYRCEDERFELDVVIETNASTIRVLEGVNKKLSRMNADEVSKFRLDDCLGGSSPTIHQRALKRIYGDKAPDIIDGLKKNPVVAVPVVLRRLKAKDDEWREAQKGFNKIWREQNEKYYLKSLDHQGMNFKQNDMKSLRSKNLFSEIENLFDENDDWRNGGGAACPNYYSPAMIVSPTHWRHEQAEDNGEVTSGPHMVLNYKDKTILDDAANLLIHHVKRQAQIHKEDKQRIKQLLRHFLPDMFFHPRQDLSEDEREDEDKEDGNMEVSGNSNNLNISRGRKDQSVKREPAEVPETEIKSEPEDVKPPGHLLTPHLDEHYTLFFGNNHWYLFLRLHQILCERLTRMYERAVALAAEENKYKKDRKESTAVALRLKPKGEIEVDDYYPAFLDMVKNVLDGNMDGNAYEDTLREMFGIHAYHAFTLDKVVSYAVRQLQHLVTDDSCQECIEMFQEEQKKGGAGGLVSSAYQRVSSETAYQRRAEQALSDENCFKIYIYELETKLTIELLDTDIEEQEQKSDGKWNYSDRFGNTGDLTSGLERLSGDDDEIDTFLRDRSQKLLFLPRNIRLFRQRMGRYQSGNEPVDGERAMVKKRSKRDHSIDDMEDECSSTKNKDKHSSSDEEKSPDESTPEHSNVRLNNTSNSRSLIDDSRRRYNLGLYRMVFVANKENFMYRRSCLLRAIQVHSAVSLRLSERFRKWHDDWMAEHVTELLHKICVDWLMGKGDGIIPNRTRVLTDNDVNRPPYRVYNRYSVERLTNLNSVSSGSPPPVTDSES